MRDKALYYLLLQICLSFFLAKILAVKLFLAFPVTTVCTSTGCQAMGTEN